MINHVDNFYSYRKNNEMHLFEDTDIFKDHKNSHINKQIRKKLDKLSKDTIQWNDDLITSNINIDDFKISTDTYEDE